MAVTVSCMGGGNSIRRCDGDGGSPLSLHRSHWDSPTAAGLSQQLRSLLLSPEWAADVSRTQELTEQLVSTLLRLFACHQRSCVAAAAAAKGDARLGFELSTLPEDDGGDVQVMCSPGAAGEASKVHSL